MFTCILTITYSCYRYKYFIIKLCFIFLKNVFYPKIDNSRVKCKKHLLELKNNHLQKILRKASVHLKVKSYYLCFIVSAVKQINLITFSKIKLHHLMQWFTIIYHCIQFRWSILKIYFYLQLYFILQGSCSIQIISSREQRLNRQRFLRLQNVKQTNISYSNEIT